MLSLLASQKLKSIQTRFLIQTISPKQCKHKYQKTFKPNSSRSRRDIESRKHSKQRFNSSLIDIKTHVHKFEKHQMNICCSFEMPIIMRNNIVINSQKRIYIMEHLRLVFEVLRGKSEFLVNH